MRPVHVGVLLRKKKKQCFAQVTTKTFGLGGIYNYLSSSLNLYHSFKISQSTDMSKDILASAADMYKE